MIEPQHNNLQTPFTPSTFRQGLRFVLIPALASTMLFGLLNILWWQIGQIAEQEERQCQLVLQLNILSSKCISFGYSLLHFGFNQIDYEKLKAEQDRQTIFEALEHGRALVQTVPQEKAPFEEMANSIESAITNFEKSMPAMTQTHLYSNLQRLRTYSGLVNKAIEIGNRINQFQQGSVKRLSDHRQATALLIPWLQGFILLGFIISIGISVVLTIRFARQIILRLQILKDHARELTTLSQEHNQLTGSDELAYLDNVLFDTSASLLQAKEQRALVLQMIAHDVRSPAMAALVHLEIFEEQTNDLPLVESYDACQSAKKELKSMLDDVNHLLEQKSSESRKNEQPSSESTARTSGSGAEKGKSSRFGFLQKCILISALPVLLQCSLMILMADKVESAKALIASAKQQTDAAICINQILISLYGSYYGMANYVIGHDPKYRAINEVSGAFARLEAQKYVDLMSNDPAQKKTASELKMLTNLQLDMGTKLLKSKSESSAVEAQLGFMPTLIRFSQKVNDRFEAVTQDQISEISKTRLSQQKSREQIQLIAILAIPLNLALAAILLYLLSSRVTSRLANLARLTDASKIIDSKSKVQLPQTAGGDEIEQLQNVLAMALSDLQQAEREREQLTETISASMRRPLLHARKDLSIIIDEPLALPGKAREHIANAGNNIDRVLKLVSSLLPLQNARADKIAIAKKASRISKLFEDSSASVRALAAKHQIEIICKNETGSDNIYIDSERMVQVLTNLLANAIKFSPQNGTVTVLARKVEGHTTISVRDQGRGMDQDTLERIFDKFYRASSQEHAGYGLGLTICKLIVEAHGGTVEATSKLGQGSTFIITL